MSQLLDQFAQIDDATAGEVARRLEAGEPAGRVADALGLGSVGVVAALGRVGLGPEGSDGPALVQEASKHPRLVEAIGRETTLADLLPGAGRPGRLALAAGLLQILDAWDASHHAAQGADDLGEVRTAAAWHMVAHRREPDAFNARYWARRARPGAFAAVGRLAAPILGGPDADVAGAARLTVGGWDPSALIDLCGRARPGTPPEGFARRLQRAEMLALLAESTAAVAG